MSVYRKFNRNDILFSTIHSRPRVSAKYGAAGWEGNTGPSASLSLYGGIRSRYDVKSSDFASSGLSIYPLDPLDTHSIDKVIFVSGSYPSTGSIRFVRVEDRPFTTFLQVTDVHWFDEHFKPIELLYDFYERIDTNYFLGNHDFYTPLILADSGNVARPSSYFIFSGAFSGKPITGPTSSFTAESWVKLVPYGTSSVLLSGSTIMSQEDLWNIHVTRTGRISVGGASDSATTASLVNLPLGSWHHVAVVFNSSSASVWLDGILGDTVLIPGSGLTSGSDTKPFIVGSRVSGSTPRLGWNGFLAETRVWNRAMLPSEIMSNASGTMVNSSSVNLVHYARYNDGPYGVAHGFVSGSGAFDYSPRAHHGRTVPWSNSHQVHWQPSDHPTFYADLKRVNVDTKDIRVVHVPSMFYGRQIDPGTVSITDGVYNSKRIVRVLNDDGRGTLYVSGSMTRPVSGEDYTGQPRRKVGNVFYTEGLIALTDPAFSDMFDSGSIFWDTTVSVSGVFGDLLSVDFKGQSRMHTKVFNCRLSTAQGNASNNPTYSFLDDQGTVSTDDDRTEVVGEDGTTWITAVGLYNEERKLVGVAKLAQPIRKREKDKVNIRLKVDI